MKIYFATWLFDKTLGESLTKKQCEKRLLSYFFLNEGNTTKEQFNRYCKIGRLNPNKK